MQAATSWLLETAKEVFPIVLDILAGVGVAAIALGCVFLRETRRNH